MSVIDRGFVLLNVAVYIETFLLTICGILQFILECPASIPYANYGRVQFTSECPASVPQANCGRVQFIIECPASIPQEGN